MATNGEKIPITLQLGNKLLADGAVVKPSTFSSFTECLTESHELTEPKTVEGRLRRVRLTKQVTYYANGTVVPVSMLDVLQLSITSVRALMIQLDADDDGDKAGKIVSPAMASTSPLSMSWACRSNCRTRSRSPSWSSPLKCTAMSRMS